MNKIWTEKYRPQVLDEIVGQKHVTDRLKAFVKKKSLPHLLFAGPAGVGKTTSALAISKEMFDDRWKNNFLEMNASDERGIDTIRTKVKDFARTRAIGEHDFKIIYLDEADSLTRDAQQALRRMMESYSNTCRFILGCNWSSKIISPIQSRTAIFRFSPVDDKELKKYIKAICEKEDLDVEDDALERIVYVSEGDIRKALNILQTVASIDEKITKKTVDTVTSSADPNVVKNMLEDVLNGSYKKARKKLTNLMVNKGLGGDDIVKEIYRQLKRLDIKDEKKLKLMTKLGEYEFRITEGSDAFIQLEAMLSNFMLVGK